VADSSTSLAPGNCPISPTRELAQRQSGADEVVLLWYPDSDRVELAIHNLTTDTRCQIEVAPGDALDSFYHPFAYASRSKRCDHVWEATTIDDG
jgi:hypothetical protein